VYLRRNSINLPYQVPVYAFMNSNDFRQYARKYIDTINDEKKIEIYYDRADEIGLAFTNYQIASVDIIYATIEEAVKIFWRVNATGLISKDWIASALTIKDDFRLGTEIDKLLSELKPYNYDKINRDIIFQCIQNSFGKIYFDYEIEDLVSKTNFREVAKNTVKSINKAVKFLYEDLLVLNSSLIPYNSQLIFITLFFNSIGDNEPTENQIITLKKWFWVTTYSNYFTIYSLSDQRKAYEQFNTFIDNENNNPIYNDKGDIRFTTLEFPEKINMKSVRAKALVLFMINYSKGVNSISLQKVNVDTIEEFEIGNLFSVPKKENPAENFVPVIVERKIEEVGKIFINSIRNSIKKPKDYSFLLKNADLSLFISEEMVKLYDETAESIDRIHALRKELIANAEKSFVENCLNIEYLM